MRKRFNDIFCVFQIHLARLRAEAGPFFLAAIVYPTGMYLFASGIAKQTLIVEIPNNYKLHLIAASLVFSLSLTAISWFGYLLLENRFTGRLKLFATLPLRPTSYIFGVLIFAIGQGALGTISMFIAAWFLGVTTQFSGALGIAELALVVFLALMSLSGISIVIAARARSFSEGSLLTDALGAGMVLLAPIYYPRETFPEAIRWVGDFLPTTYIFKAIDKVVAGDTFIWNEVGTLAAIAAVVLTVGFWQLNWREN